MKKFSDLREALNDVGIVTDIMQPRDLAHLKNLARQISSAWQSTVDNTLHMLEVELNKWAFTLGELDLDMDIPAEGNEDYVILVASTGEVIRNVYLSMQWSTLASGQSSADSNLRADGSKLKLDVKVTVNEIDPADFDDLMANDDPSDDSGYDETAGEIPPNDSVAESAESKKKLANESKFDMEDDNDDPDGKKAKAQDTKGDDETSNQPPGTSDKTTKVDTKDSDDSKDKKPNPFAKGKDDKGRDDSKAGKDKEEVKESFLIKKMNKTLNVDNGDNASLHFEVLPNGGIVFQITEENGTSTFKVNVNKAADVMTRIMDHFISYTKQ